jgi:Asp-tRNA(Asn)/Glu-tRNA(Gln) amidotransferase C subunit
MDFLFKKLSDKDKEEIRKQVDNILGSFSDKLSQLKEEVNESIIERDDFQRLEDEKEKPCEIDREIMFENAPDKNKDFIVGEKGAWK